MRANKILIVDDQPENLSGLVDIIEFSTESYEVFQALNGNIALTIAKNERPDLIITDWEMPEMDGVELIKSLKKDFDTRNIPVIMCTGIMTNVRNLKTAMEAGAVDYIRKPVDPVELTARVQSMLALSESRRTIEVQKEKVEELLLNILPAPIIDRLKENPSAITTDYFPEVSIMFADFANFSHISEMLNARELVAELGNFFSAFDQIIEKHGIEKIKTMGDAYMCAGGIPLPLDDHAGSIIRAALEIRDFVNEQNERRRKSDLDEWNIRIGIHSGPTIAGVVGKKKYSYDIWGHAVNVAARMESSGEEGKVNISADTQMLIKNQFLCTHRGQVSVKNMADIDMYFVERLKE